MAKMSCICSRGKLRGYRDVVYGPDAFLLFGRESRGLDQGSSTVSPTAVAAHPHAARSLAG
ncbi:MAG: hypothetical protein ACLUE1_08765 [Adlercreutzia equolifaciens]